MPNWRRVTGIGASRAGSDAAGAFPDRGEARRPAPRLNSSAIYILRIGRTRLGHVLPIAAAGAILGIARITKFRGRTSHQRLGRYSWAGDFPGVVTNHHARTPGPVVAAPTPQPLRSASILVPVRVATASVPASARRSASAACRTPARVVMVIELAGDADKTIIARTALAATVSKCERMSSSLEASVETSIACSAFQSRRKMPSSAIAPFDGVG